MDLIIVTLVIVAVVDGLLIAAAMLLIAKTRRTLFKLDAVLAEHLSLDPRYEKVRK